MLMTTWRRIRLMPVLALEIAMREHNDGQRSPLLILRCPDMNATMPEWYRMLQRNALRNVGAKIVKMVLRYNGSMAWFIGAKRDVCCNCMH